MGASANLLDVEAVAVNAGAGDDQVLANTMAINATLTVDAGDGNDTVVGGSGADTISGGAGDDTLVFDTANVGEVMDLAATPDSHAVLTRDVGSVFMNLDNVEHVVFGGGGGTDTIVVGDLSATDIRQVDIDLGAQGAPDGAFDSVQLTGGDHKETVVVTEGDATLNVQGLATGVSIDHADGFDRLSVNLGAGDDVFDASAVGARIAMSVEGGAGDDQETGSGGDDALSGGAGDDTPAGGAGQDVLAGGDGSDVFVFNRADAGHDLVVDFRPHGSGPGGDLIVLHGVSDHSFDEAVANGHIVQSGADVLIGDAAGSIVTLQNVSLASLHANDFLFG